MFLSFPSTPSANKEASEEVPEEGLCEVPRKNWTLNKGAWAGNADLHMGLDSQESLSP